MNDPNIDPLAQRLRAERIAQGRTLQDVAESAGVPLQTIGIWELGVTSPTLRSLRRWVSALGFDLDLIKED